MGGGAHLNWALNRWRWQKARPDKGGRIYKVQDVRVFWVMASSSSQWNCQVSVKEMWKMRWASWWETLISTCENLFVIQLLSLGFPAGVDHDKSGLQKGTSLLALCSEYDWLWGESKVICKVYWATNWFTIKKKDIRFDERLTLKQCLSHSQGEVEGVSRSWISPATLTMYAENKEDEHSLRKCLLQRSEKFLSDHSSWPWYLEWSEV